MLERLPGPASRVSVPPQSEVASASIVHRQSPVLSRTALTASVYYVSLTYAVVTVTPSSDDHHAISDDHTMPTDLQLAALVAHDPEGSFWRVVTRPRVNACGGRLRQLTLELPTVCTSGTSDHPSQPV